MGSNGLLGTPYSLHSHCWHISGAGHRNDGWDSEWQSNTQIFCDDLDATDTAVVHFVTVAFMGTVHWDKHFLHRRILLVNSILASVADLSFHSLGILLFQKNSLHG